MQAREARRSLAKRASTTKGTNSGRGVQRPDATRGLKSAARAALRDAYPADAMRRARAATKERLIPGLRTRLLRTLQEVDELRAAELGDELFIDYLARATGSVPQNARRWVAASRPGLPDLVSFSMLCEALQVDANWVLGLTRLKLSLAPVKPDWVSELAGEVAKSAGDRVGVHVRGDEMEPDIGAGDWVLVDKRQRRWGTNGVYLLEWNAREVLRSVDTRIGVGFVLGCTNSKYSETVIEDEAAATALGVRLLGRVVARIAVQRV